MLRFICSLFLCAGFLSVRAQDADTLAVKPVQPVTHQLRVSFDVSKLVQNSLADNRKSWEGALDYYLKNELYLTAEGGAGNSDINYPDLRYASSNLFFRGGIDKALFVRKKPQDWGMGFIGLRYGFGLVKREEAHYTTDDGLGGITNGVVASDRFTVHWLELTGGMRVELFRHCFAGWNVRIRFLLNQQAMGDLKPAYIAGYGAGEKATAFDYNFYLAYALRWSSAK
jgi:hypothetical protein